MLYGVIISRTKTKRKRVFLSEGDGYAAMEKMKGSDPVLQFQALRDPEADMTAFRPEDHREALERASALLDATDPELDRFFDRGGKLLLLHGAYDQIVPYYGTRDYYRALEQRFGAENLRRHARYFLIPGYGHGCGPRELNTDLVELLDRWVERDDPPEQIAGESCRLESGERLCYNTPV